GLFIPLPQPRPRWLVHALVLGVCAVVLQFALTAFLAARAPAEPAAAVPAALPVGAPGAAGAVGVAAAPAPAGCAACDPGLAQAAPTAQAALTGPSPAPTDAPQPLALRSYVVQPGDELRAIAQKFGLRNETVIWANDLANPDLLLAGTELVIPPED